MSNCELHPGKSSGFVMKAAIAKICVGVRVTGAGTFMVMEWMEKSKGC